MVLDGPLGSGRPFFFYHEGNADVLLRSIEGGSSRDEPQPVSVH
jgi:hypothetical protein